MTATRLSILVLLSFASASASAAEIAKDFQQCQGDWKIVTYLAAGELDKDVVGQVATIDGKNLSFPVKGETDKTDCRLDLDAKTPGNVVVSRRLGIGELEVSFNGIILINPDIVMLCAAQNSKASNPKEFTSTKDDQQTLMILRRLKK